MTLDEALEILEVHVDQDRQVVRRAYLRLVKRHTPERDPQGFIQVRLAWDTFTEHITEQRLLEAFARARCSRATQRALGHSCDVTRRAV